MSKKRKKKGNHDEHMGEDWLLPYADLLTLLLALFIVLFASSSVDAQKFQSLSSAFSQVFSSGTGIMNFPSPMPEKDAQSYDPETDKGENEYKEDEDNKNKLQQSEREQLAVVQHKVQQYIKENNLENKLDTSLSGEGLLVTIRSNVLFKSGSADVRKQDVKIAKEISALLVMDLPRSVIISGHTDNIPISNSKYESNWELSVMRAVNFMKIILDNDKLDPKLFSAKGFGEFQPIASNKTEKGRAKNRRVEILILPKGTQNQP
ncbi:flagellar motor protein MotB [Bacillus massilinigeriensis]|uniref:flagellar motor protein MotB n=1 Tax=Bacillus massilionigeriensis TaxID=1805475 RepID=UPI00096B03F3|nr:flagellar motor protein MotB [Bacillus massilionigeriensis]